MIDDKDFPYFQMNNDAAIALKLHKAGCREGIIDYCWQTLRDSGYSSPEMFKNVDVAIQRMKTEEMPQCFESSDEPKALTAFERFQMSRGAAL